MSHFWEFLLLPRNIRVILSNQQMSSFRCKIVQCVSQKQGTNDEERNICKFPRNNRISKIQLFFSFKCTEHSMEVGCRISEFFWENKTRWWWWCCAEFFFPSLPVQMSQKGCMSVEHHFCGANRKNRFSAICGETTLKKLL